MWVWVASGGPGVLLTAVFCAVPMGLPHSTLPGRVKAQQRANVQEILAGPPGTPDRGLQTLHLRPVISSAPHSTPESWGS